MEQEFLYLEKEIGHFKTKKSVDLIISTGFYFICITRNNFALNIYFK